MNTYGRLRRALANPVFFLRHANRLYHRRLGRRENNTDGVSIFEEDWDNLLLLDACRYDMFARRSELPGRLESRQSQGSATAEFLEANVDGRDLRDTVYVTANPQLLKNRDSIRPQFYAVVNVWDEGGWDEDYGTVLPETVTEYAERAAREYPNKRLFVHYIQPHYPFVDADNDISKDHLLGTKTRNVWGDLSVGSLDIDRAEVWRLYEGNLDRAMPHVEELMEALYGKTVVTADHGNMVGERAFPIPIREWGHPRGIYTDELVTVPWLVHKNGPRREIQAGDVTTESESVDNDVVADRLEDLGYVDKR